VELHWKAEAFCREHLSPIFLVVHQYMAASIKSGEMREVDPSMATAALVSTVFMHSGFARLVDNENTTVADSLKAARAYTKFWLDLLEPHPSVTRTKESVDQREEISLNL
jgi:hypothetical protein